MSTPREIVSRDKEWVLTDYGTDTYQGKRVYWLSPLGWCDEAIPLNASSARELIASLIFLLPDLGEA